MFLFVTLNESQTVITIPYLGYRLLISDRPECIDDYSANDREHWTVRVFYALCIWNLNYIVNRANFCRQALYRY